MAPFGHPLGFLWALSGSLRAPSGGSEDTLGALWDHIGTHEAYLEGLWWFFWVSLGSFGPPFGRCGALFDVINASL